jgi:glutathione S-transferase
MSHALEITRTFNAPPSRVFACFTNREDWSAWAGPQAIQGEVTLLEPKVGGRYRIVMHRPDGAELVAGGEFQVLEEPSRLAFTWKWEHGQDTTLVTIFLRDVGGKTEMHFRHEGFTSEEDRDRHNDGWTGCFIKLEAFAATGERQKGVGLKGAA